ncbi:MAG: hypothetical protein Q9213_002314 [Squamulea squamosa]
MDNGGMDIDMDIDLGPIDIPEVSDINGLTPQISTGPLPDPPTDILGSVAVTHKVHLTGVDHLATDDVKAFVAEHYSAEVPSRFEWVDDSSINIVYGTPAAALRALEFFTLPSTHQEAVSTSTLHLRPAKTLSKRPESILQVRTAVSTDVKRPRAHEASRFYLMNPEFDPRATRACGRKRTEGDNDYQKRRYGDGEHRRRRLQDKENGFKASFYDDLGIMTSNEHASRRSSLSMKSDVSSLADGHSTQRRRSRHGHFGDYYRPGKVSDHSFRRNRSASPGKDEDNYGTIGGPRIRQRTPPPANHKKELFPVKSATMAPGKELFPNKSIAASLKQELFPTKTTNSHHRRTDAFDAADETADLFAAGMAISDRGSKVVAVDPSFGRLRGSDPVSQYVPHENVEDGGISIRGASKIQESGVSIRGAAGVSPAENNRELFPSKMGNVGKELFTEKLQGRAFLTEAGLPPDAGSIKPGDLTIEKVLEEKKVFDLTLNFEKSNIAVDGRQWSSPAPERSWPVESLPSSSNLLHVSVEDARAGIQGGKRQILFASTADRRLNLIELDGTFSLLDSLSHIHDSPILSCTVLPLRRMITLTTSMSGQVVLYDHQAKRAVDERRDHKKYVIKAAQIQHGGSTWLATAGWDAEVILYRVQNEATSDACCFGDPVALLSLATNPETITFITHPESNRPVLLVTRRDSTSIHYYHCEENDSSTSMSINLRLLGSQNLAPHSNAWISFSPSSVALCPTNSELLAVATSAVPHMKLIIVRMLIPSPTPDTTTARGPSTQATQIRQKLAIEDQEDAAIQLSVNTFAPQTPYSTPQVSWRPDGSGIWVNGDDGVLRGLGATTGKICSTLKGGHEPGSKIRSVWAGMVEVDGKQEEWVISGGFDKRLVVWKPSEGQKSSN